MSRIPRATQTPQERVLLCGVRFSDVPPFDDEDLSEAAGLVQAAEGVVVGEGIIQRMQRPTPATLFGSGKVIEIGQEIGRVHPDAVVVDNELSPAQGRNLEKAWNVRIIDRSELILDIFARRARTRQARLQVELAQNEYLAPRLRRMWTHLERNEGAIGARGPGETQLETDKRLIRRRIQDLREELRTIEERKQREVRTRAEQFTIGLVGYTNAGKSTLLNRLTGADELAADMLFATLDTRTRQWRLSDGRTVLLSDTVGFVQRLPHHLVASFHATLEEALHADLLLHIVDAAHERANEQMKAVEDVLRTVLRGPREEIVVLNKADRVGDPVALAGLERSAGESSILISAVTGLGLEDLDARVRDRLDAQSRLVDVYMPASAGRLDAQIRSICTPLEREYVEEHDEVRVRVRLSDGQAGFLRRAAGPQVRFVAVGGDLREGPDEAAAIAAPSRPPRIEGGGPDRVSAAGT
ncbi:MAG: GTPase HflX [Planctomycetota bacterium]|nr:GTPase HflX [Planctomycetota bacterium]